MKIRDQRVANVFSVHCVAETPANMILPVLTRNEQMYTENSHHVIDRGY